MQNRLTLALLLIFAAVGWFRAIQTAEAPLPVALHRNGRAMVIRINRCTVREYAAGRRIFGFARLEKVEGYGGRLGQQIYYNLALSGDLPVPQRGQPLEVRAAIHSTAGSKVPFERYLAETGVRSRIDRGQVIAVGRGYFFSEALAKIFARSSAALSYSMDLGEQAGRIYGAMLLGDRSQLSSQEKDTYSRTGIAHLFAISGLHIGVIAAFLGALTRGLPLPSWPLLLLRLSLLGVFVAMTGASPSALRAFAMVTSLWTAPLFFRRATGLASLSAAALLNLFLDPMALYSTGFQFSYAVVFALFCFGVPLGSYLRRMLFPLPPLFEERRQIDQFFRRLAARLVDAIALSISATIPLIPLSIYHFQTFSIGGILLNLLVIPVAEVAIICGFGSVCCGLLHLTAGCHLLNFFAYPFLWTIGTSANAVGSFSWVQSRPLSVGPSVLIPWCAALFLAIGRCRESSGWKFFLAVAVALLPLPFLPTA
ncbi:MAG: ComEC/Rec2 family competence protein [Puniceicoccales bacterium]|jgi:competence protein ComEC|nr:ComEC/Rec2 family competence protein [Puniceicoccales bacterium]